MAEMDAVAVLDLLVGVIIVSVMLLRPALRRFGIPAAVGFLLLGLLLRVAHDEWHFITENGTAVLEFMASIGIIVLLFRVGLESNVHALISKLPRAGPIWIGNVGLSGIGGYLVANLVYDLAVLPSLFVAVALTATSVAVSVEVWRECGMLNTANGETLLDVAELDDLSAVVLLAILVGVAPALIAGNGGLDWGQVRTIGALVALKAFGFLLFCFLLARYAEGYVSAALRRTDAPDSILIVIGIGILVAALAAFLGFSLAIGALFAGLIFSGDPEAVKLETSFMPIYTLFAPFFFIGIGLAIDPSAIAPGLGIGGALLAVAILGKVLGAGGPALLTTGWAGAAAIGLSMVPRAEIAMVVAEHGRRLGDAGLPLEIYTALAMVALVTSTAAPLTVRWILRHWPAAGDDTGSRSG